MTLQEALALVQKQFVAEVQPGEGLDEDARKALRSEYDQARQDFPAAMEVAHQVWANELIRQNLARAMQAQQQAKQQAAGAGGGQPQMPPPAAGFMAPPKG